MLLGSYTAKVGNGTGANATAWPQSKPVQSATLFAPVRILSGTLFVVQCVRHSQLPWHIIIAK